jgi:haloacetate dehalogenase
MEQQMKHHASLEQVGDSPTVRPSKDASSAAIEVQTLTSGSTASQKFERHTVNVAGNRVFFRRYGNGPAILMVHGFPRTSLMWRDLARYFATDHTVICVDLRAYGGTGVPPSSADHSPYTKRQMARELVGLMDELGFEKFIIVGHDRGGRVSYRLALDHPHRVEKLAVLDVIPISEAWDRTDRRFQTTYWPWALLSQRAPLPETYLKSAPEAVFKDPFGRGSFGPEILNEYLETFQDPTRLHGICEEYRAAATLDVDHDHADRQANRQIHCPVLHLWAERGPLDRFYTADGGPLGIWRKWAPAVEGHAMKGGHFFPEENPDDTAIALRKFIEN